MTNMAKMIRLLRWALAVFMDWHCHGCGAYTMDARWRGAMTAYYWDGKTGANPNADNYLCPSCREDYESYWNERWDEYRSAQGF